MRQRDRIALILVASVLVVAPFALGGAPRWAICITSLLSAAAAASFVFSRREMATISPLLAFVGLAALLTLLQVVPLPAAVVALLSPGKHQLVVENARALDHAPPSWTPLSLDPPATLLELAKLCGYVAFAYAALRVAASEARRTWMLMVVAGVGAAMAATALIHVLLDLDKVFGLYQPKQTLKRPTLAPLLNHNHLSALMAMSAPIALGLAFTVKGHLRLAWIGVLALCAGVGFLAESRGGAIALVIGLAVVGVVAMLQLRGPRSAARMSLTDKVAIAAVAMSSLVLVGIFTAGGVLRDLASTRMSEVGAADSRFAAWRSSSSLLQEYPLSGIGRGSFEMASTRVHDSRAAVYPHVENEYLQAVVDWGFLGAAALALILVWLAVNAARAARASLLEAGALGGIVALAVENFTDFSLWMPGIAYPALATLAVLLSAPLVADSKTKNWWRPARITGIVAVATVVAIAASPVGKGAWVETKSVAAAQSQGTPADAVGRAERAFERHPSHYAAAGLLAQALFNARDRRAIAVANRALELHPTSGELHLLTGRMLLASQQRDQARSAYASALRYLPRRETLDEILAVFPDDASAVRAMPLEPTMIRDWADQLRQRNRVPLALAFLQRYLTYFPDDGPIHLHTAAAALDGDQISLAAEAAKRAYDLDPNVAATIMLAKVRLRQNDPAQARSVLESRLDQTHLEPHERVELTLMACEVLVSEGNPDAARHRLRAVLNLAEGRQLAEVHRRLGAIEERLGNRHQAAWERQRAEEIDR